MQTNNWMEGLNHSRILIEELGYKIKDYHNTAVNFSKPVLIK